MPSQGLEISLSGEHIPQSRLHHPTGATEKPRFSACPLHRATWRPSCQPVLSRDVVRGFGHVGGGSLVFWIAEVPRSLPDLPFRKHHRSKENCLRGEDLGTKKWTRSLQRIHPTTFGKDRVYPQAQLQQMQVNPRHWDWRDPSTKKWNCLCFSDNAVLRSLTNVRTGATEHRVPRGISLSLQFNSVTDSRPFKASLPTNTWRRAFKQHWTKALSVVPSSGFLNSDYEPGIF